MLEIGPSPRLQKAIKLKNSVIKLQTGTAYRFTSKYVIYLLKMVKIRSSVGLSAYG